MKGLVIKNTGSWYTVLTDDGLTVDCKVKGNFRIKGIRSTNPVAVGDRVTVSLPPTPSNWRGSSEGASIASPSRGRMEGASASWLIDTPGIKGFGTFDMEREELTSYFREIFEYSKQCRFSDCTHTHEPGCAVLKAVEDHLIAPSRYQSYLSMLDDKDENKYREAY